MIRIFPSWILPLNITEIYGTMCCNKMYQHYQNNYLKQHGNCYEAKSIFEANCLVIWGSLSSKLLNGIKNHLEDMLEKKYIIHLQGCELRLNNAQCMSSLNTIETNRVITTCDLSFETYTSIIKEARLCLLA